MELPVAPICSGPWCTAEQKCLPSLDVSSLTLKGFLERAWKYSLTAWNHFYFCDIWARWFPREITWKYKCFSQIRSSAMSLGVMGSTLVLMDLGLGVLDSWGHPWKRSNPNVKVVYFFKTTNVGYLSYSDCFGLEGRVSATWHWTLTPAHVLALLRYNWHRTL